MLPLLKAAEKKRSSVIFIKKRVKRYRDWCARNNNANNLQIPLTRRMQAIKKAAVRLPHSLIANYYSLSATTSFTSGIIRFIMPSMPLFKVIIDEGQPEQEPCIIRFTTPSL